MAAVQGEKLNSNGTWTHVEQISQFRPSKQAKVHTKTFLHICPATQQLNEHPATDPPPAGQSSAMFANPGRAAALFCRTAGVPKGEAGASSTSPTCSYKEKKSPLLTCVFCLVRHWQFWVASMSTGVRVNCCLWNCHGHQNVLWSVNYSQVVRKQVKCKKSDVFRLQKQNKPWNTVR